jgi:paraquat-inducible protein A
VLAALAIGLWAAGVSLPILQVTKLFLWEDEIVIWQAMQQLFLEGQTVLGLILVLFTLVLPLAKVFSTGYAFRALRHARTESAARTLGWIERFGRWSMLDVFVIAVAVFAAKSGWQAEAQIRPGLYCFAGFAILSSALAVRVKQLTDRVPARAASRSG